MNDEVAAYLRDMHALNTSVIQELTPILEQRLGIDLRLHFIMVSHSFQVRITQV